MCMSLKRIETTSQLLSVDSNKETISLVQLKIAFSEPLTINGTMQCVLTY